MRSGSSAAHGRTSDGSRPATRRSAARSSVGRSGQRSTRRSRSGSAARGLDGAGGPTNAGETPSWTPRRSSAPSPEVPEIAPDVVVEADSWSSVASDLKSEGRKAVRVRTPVSPPLEGASWGNDGRSGAPENAKQDAKTLSLFRCPPRSCIASFVHGASKSGSAANPSRSSSRPSFA